jgi:hypothetical protein
MPLRGPITVLFLFLGWIALSTVWVAMFTQRGRLIFARRGYQFRRVRWTSAIAATITFVLLCAVAQKVPPSSEAGKTPVAEPPTSPVDSHEAQQSLTADAQPIEAADCDDLGRFAEYVAAFRANASGGSPVTEDEMLFQAEQKPPGIRPYALRMTRSYGIQHSRGTRRVATLLVAAKPRALMAR